MTDRPKNIREHFEGLRRAHVIGEAERLGLTISAIPGGHRVCGRHVDLWVTDLQFVRDDELYAGWAR